MFGFGSFNGFEYYDYVCEISKKKKKKVFQPIWKNKFKKYGKISQKYMKNDGIKYKKSPKTYFLKIGYNR
jgi:hypothetical protein